MSERPESRASRGTWMRATAFVFVVLGAFSFHGDACLAQSPPAVHAPTPPERCRVNVIDVSPYVDGNVVRFVFGGREYRNASADVLLVTQTRLYGLTIPSLSVAATTETGFDFSQPYAAALANASQIKGVYLRSWMDPTGIKHNCDILSGLPERALPYFTTMPFSRTVEDRIGRRAIAAASPMPTVGFARFTEHYDCDEPFAKASVLGQAAAPQYPDSARAARQAGAVVVRVALDQNGKIVLASVGLTSGIPALDASAVAAATNTAYRPAVSECRAVPSIYLFRADFEQS